MKPFSRSGFAAMIWNGISKASPKVARSAVRYSSEFIEDLSGDRDIRGIVYAKPQADQQLPDTSAGTNACLWADRLSSLPNRKSSRTTKQAPMPRLGGGALIPPPACAASALGVKARFKS